MFPAVFTPDQEKSKTKLNNLLNLIGYLFLLIFLLLDCPSPRKLRRCERNRWRLKLIRFRLVTRGGRGRCVRKVKVAFFRVTCPRATRTHSRCTKFRRVWRLKFFRKVNCRCKAIIRRRVTACREFQTRDLNFFNRHGDFKFFWKNSSISHYLAWVV